MNKLLNFLNKIADEELKPRKKMEDSKYKCNKGKHYCDNDKWAKKPCICGGKFIKQ